jgi:hypothetical protein
MIREARKMRKEQIRLVREVVRISQSHQKRTTKMLLSLNRTILGID